MKTTIHPPDSPAETKKLRNHSIRFLISKVMRKTDLLKKPTLEPVKPIIFHQASHLTGISGLLGLIFAACTLVSCSTGSPTTPVSSPVTLQSSHWFKAKNDPPTYFPKGVPADHPTTYNDGSWVMTGDAAGTRYFIPLRGVDSSALTAEALTTMTPERRKDLERGGPPDVNLADGIGKTATGLGYLLLELDQQSGASWGQQGAGRGQSGLWENKERR